MAERRLRAFVIGWPISHSLSPDLHRYWLRQYGINGSYEKIAVAPADLDVFLDSIRENNFVGGNVTIPHKEDVYTKIPNRNSTANKLQAANTLWYENGILKAGNTDVYGFTANLDDFAADWRKAKTALVLGAGGASKAATLALVNAGIEKIFIVNRTLTRARTLADKMGSQCKSHDFDDLPKLLRQTDLLVNTTSLGMKGQPQLNIDLSPLPKSAIVTDIVYNPLNTQLLCQANSLNMATVDGIGMLLHQAVPGFEKWFGVRPQVTAELRNHMLHCLKAAKS